MFARHEVTEIQKWVQEVCQAISSPLADFARERCGVSVLRTKGLTVPPGATIFNIVLRHDVFDNRDVDGLLHELAHARLDHRELNPSRELRAAYEEQANRLKQEWLCIWESRDYKPDVTNAHPFPAELQKEATAENGEGGQ